MRWRVWPLQSTRTFWALMVIPRSRSRSIVSRYWERMSRASTAFVISKMRSLSVLLPWSMWAMMEKLRMRERSMASRQMLSASVRGWLEHSACAVSLATLIQPASQPKESPNVANIKSQKKRILTNAKAAERNKAVKNEAETGPKNDAQGVGEEEGEAG